MHTNILNLVYIRTECGYELTSIYLFAFFETTVVYRLRKIVLQFYWRSHNFHTSL